MDYKSEFAHASSVRFVYLNGARYYVAFYRGISNPRMGTRIIERFSPTGRFTELEFKAVRV